MQGRYILFFTAATFFLSSCKKFVQVAPPDYQLSSDLVFSSDAAATSAVVSIYSLMMTSSIGDMTPFSGYMTVLEGLYADELTNADGSGYYSSFEGNTVAPTDNWVSNTWQNIYSLLYQTNSCLEGLNKATGLTPSLKRQLTGESEFIRAYCFFYLVNYFGDVPLVTTTDYTANATMPRTPRATVYQQMIRDLKDALLLLQENYPTSGRVRPNKWAATALLARVYLYAGDWTNAQAMASEVIGSGTYLPLPAPGAAFLIDNKEAIWQLMPGAPNLDTYDGQIFIPASPSVIPPYALTAGLLSAFEPADLRLNNWVASQTYGGTSYYYPFKYKVNGSAVPSEYSIQLRLSEQYLIRAEALAHQNNIPDAVADLNVIRSRAGLPALAGNLTQPACLLAVEQERRIELFAEMGHRFLDLKRTGRADAVLSSEKPDWHSKDTLLPIPTDQLKANPFLTQNPGYLN